MFPLLIKSLVPMKVGIKAIKYFFDSTFREKVTPVPGSVLYCDLWIAVEHSGVYVGEGAISNIVVDGMAESSVCRSTPDDFTSKSTLGRRIYVSCDSNGAVGHRGVARYADASVGERAFYGLVFKNCHQFSQRCVQQSGGRDAPGLADRFVSMLPTNETWEPTMAALKSAARERLGATKWRLWDWTGDEDEQPPEEPDWQAHKDYFEHLPLDIENISRIRDEIAAAASYEQEIADEDIPHEFRQRLADFQQTLRAISEKYEEAKGFLTVCHGASFSYADLRSSQDDFAALASTLQNSQPIRDLVRKMGRDYVNQAKKKQTRVPQASKSEVHGTHRSDDVARVLPSELLNLEDETLEALFYARLLERQLLTYELSGTSLATGEETEDVRKCTGPVVACLDTSGSMAGAPLLKAKALLLAIAHILNKESRSLHVLLFGSAGELREFSMTEQSNAAGLLSFLQNGFGGGTDFETPINRAFEIISSNKDYQKADVLMISDGDFKVSSEFVRDVEGKKSQVDCVIYSVLCAGSRVEDGICDEVVVL